MLSAKHPQYIKMAPIWKQLRDFHQGSDAVKNAGIAYLPATEGMVIDGMGAGQRGLKAYEAYKMRARVPDYITEGVKALVGLLHQKPPTIRLPENMEFLREKATAQGESLVAMMRRVNFEQLIIGRLGLFGDIMPGETDPHIGVYTGESIINWNVREDEMLAGKLRLVVMDESGDRFNKQNLGWEHVVQHRVAWLDDSGVYCQKVFQGPHSGFDPSTPIVPMWRGTTLQFIPFEFINSTDTLSDIDAPPLQSLLDICIGIYLGEADFRQNLYMQTQQTLVVKGGVQNPDGEVGKDADALRTGAGARIDVGPEGDAKYIGTDPGGLQMQSKAIADDRRRAELKAGELVQQSRSQAESGKAMATRYNAQTATLNALATAGAEGIQGLLRKLAVWMGEKPEDVIIVPNTEFIDFSLDGRSFADIMSAIRENGLPLSLESVHAILADRGLTNLDFNTEMERIDGELKQWAPVIEMMQKLTAKQQLAEVKTDVPATNVGGNQTGNEA